MAEWYNIPEGGPLKQPKQSEGKPVDRTFVELSTDSPRVVLLDSLHRSLKLTLVDVVVVQNIRLKALNEYKESRSQSMVLPCLFLSIKPV